MDLVYVRGDWSSYLSNVRNTGRISLIESEMKERLTKGRVIFRDTEFPVDSEGNYLEPQ